MERPFYPSFIVATIPKLLAFLPVTLLVLFLTVIAGSILGFFLARARVTRRRFAARFAEGYTRAMRCTPSIVLLFIVYYGLPKLFLELFRVDINGIYKGIFVIITMTLLFAATMSELMRSAYEAVDRGQREAAVSIGLSETEAFFRITAPQALLFALPNFGNSVITLLKEGALAYTIGLIDMMGQGNLIIARRYGAYGLETFLALALIYWALTILFERSFLAVEKRLARGKRGA